jgi:hypothetical protein
MKQGGVIRSSTLDSPGHPMGLGGSWKGMRSAPNRGVTKIIMESHGLVSVVSHKDDRSQQWAI